MKLISAAVFCCCAGVLPNIHCLILLQGVADRCENRECCVRNADSDWTGACGQRQKHTATQGVYHSRLLCSYRV